MKCPRTWLPAHRRRSLPVRGAWIEILTERIGALAQMSLPVRGAWIEIERCAMVLRYSACRSPCGERGLK